MALANFPEMKKKKSFTAGAHDIWSPTKAGKNLFNSTHTRATWLPTIERGKLSENFIWHDNMTRMRRKLRDFFLLSHISSPKSIRRELFWLSFCCHFNMIQICSGFVWAQLSLRVASFSKYRPRRRRSCLVFSFHKLLLISNCVCRMCHHARRRTERLLKHQQSFWGGFSGCANNKYLSFALFFIFPGLDSESEASVVCRSGEFSCENFLIKWINI